MIKLFSTIYLFFEKRRTCLFALFLTSIVLCGFAASKITLNEDISGFLPSSKQTRDIRFVTSNLKGQDKIIIHLTAPSGQSLDRDYSIEASEYLVEALDTIAGRYIDSYFYYIDETQVLSVAKFLASNAPLFMDDQDYERLDSLLVLKSADEILLRQVEFLASPVGGAMEGIVLSDPLSMTSRALQKLSKIGENSQYTNYQSYLFTQDFSKQVIVITPRWGTNQTAHNKGLQAAIDRAIEKTVARFESVNIHYFGAPIIAVENATQIKRDSLLSISLSLVLILGLMLYALRSFRKMLLVALPVIFGAVFAIAIIWLIQGSISAIAIGAGSIIFGIAVSYSIHFILHSAHCKSPKELIRDIAQPMTIGSLSTVGAFLSLLFIKAEAMRDFGFFAALTLVGAILFVMVLMPHMMNAKTDRTRFFKISTRRFESNSWVITSVLILTIIFSCFAPRTSFDTDLHKINYMTERQKENMRSVMEADSGHRTLCVAAVSKDSDSAVRAYNKALPIVDSLVKKGWILRVNSFGDFVQSLEEQNSRIEQWNLFWSVRNKEMLVSDIETSAAKFGFREEAFGNFYAMMDKEFKVQDLDFYKSLPFVNEFIVESPEGIAMTLFLTVPKEHAEKIIKAMDAIQGIVAFDKDSVGSSMVGMLAADFNFVLYICGAIVFILLWLSFGRIEITLVAFVPMIIAWIWILGIMAIFGIDFNIINIILATFIFGLGDDFSIFITDGLMHEYAYGSKITDSHKSAVILSALTMLCGIGTLVFAKHPAMLSLAYLTLIGMGSVVIMAYVIPPFLFKYLISKNGHARLVPITLRNFSLSVYSFVVFLLGSLFLTLSGFVLLSLMGASAINKMRYHKLLCFVARSVVKNLPMVKSEFLNEHAETFDKPAVIVANHQSHLDLMYMLALSPKLIILTNQWVWKSPFYGLIIRYADFLPIAGGIGNYVDKLRDLVSQGYSIVVFPEGTRSKDQYIHRFHQGAFYLASELKLDILPVVTHGIGAALPKEEFLLRHSSVLVTIMKRLSFSTSSILEQSKIVRKIMSDQLDQMIVQTENPDYFYHKVLANYIYKGADIERMARKELKENDNYNELISQLPCNGVVLMENCGIGVGSLMAALVRKELLLIATDTDSRKLLIASQCQNLPVNLKYVSEIEGINFDIKIRLS